MKSNPPTPQDKKLLVIYRLEPECLGNLGHKQINDFCAHITRSILPPDSGFIKWTVLPRVSPKEKEVELRIDGKLLHIKQINRYLAAINRDYDTLMEAVSATILKQIDHYFH